VRRKRARLLVLLCANLPPHKLTNNNELRMKTAKGWSSPEWTVRPEEINCDGCKSDSDELVKHCYECGVRACACEREVETCVHCSDYICDKLEKLLAFVGDKAKKGLEEVRRLLQT
jgi:hypothetical protein